MRGTQRMIGIAPRVQLRRLRTLTNQSKPRKAATRLRRCAYRAPGQARHEPCSCGATRAGVSHRAKPPCPRCGTQRVSLLSLAMTGWMPVSATAVAAAQLLMRSQPLLQRAARTSSPLPPCPRWPLTQAVSLSPLPATYLPSSNNNNSSSWMKVEPCWLLAAARPLRVSHSVPRLRRRTWTLFYTWTVTIRLHGP